MSFDKFYSQIKHGRKKTGTEIKGAWFRGIPDGRHELIPSLLRNKRRDRFAEINMYADFWTKIEASTINDTWQRLSFMQHFGVPTRFLDWTTDLNTALYFALIYNNNMRVGDPCIWILNPFKLNELYCGSRLVFDEADKPGFDYYECAKKNEFPNSTPVAMMPMWSNSRIRLQSGAFTFHGAPEVAMDTLVNNNIAYRVQIEHTAVFDLRKKIEAEGINDFRMLGGPDGLAMHLKKQHFN